MINISEPHVDSQELNNLKKIFKSKNFTDAYFQSKAETKISNIIKRKVFLTQSCSSALEIASILLDLKKNDEVLVPSYTFTSTANAIIMRNAKPIFVEIEKNNLCIDLNDLEKKITKKTKAIYVVHYGGNCCDLNRLLKIKRKYNLYLVEDAAHAFLAKYKNKFLGTFGDISTFSFHETKNLNGGQCGALVINNKKFLNKIDIILDKGTDRKRFVNKKKRFLLKSKKYYSWKGYGSEYRASELSAAVLCAQLNKIKIIQSVRKKVFDKYEYFFQNLNSKNFITLKNNIHLKSSFHLYVLIFNKVSEANKFKQYMKKKNIGATIHYVPLHSSSYGKLISTYKKLPITEDIFLKVVRLPLHANLKNHDIIRIFAALKNYFKK